MIENSLPKSIPSIKVFHRIYVYSKEKHVIFEKEGKVYVDTYTTSHMPWDVSKRIKIDVHDPDAIPKVRSAIQ